MTAIVEYVHVAPTMGTRRSVRGRGRVEESIASRSVKVSGEPSSVLAVMMDVIGREEQGPSMWFLLKHCGLGQRPHSSCRVDLEALLLFYCKDLTSATVQIPGLWDTVPAPWVLPPCLCRPLLRDLIDEYRGPLT
jgi:hypothetical protein